tara:strand:- start:2585 stop:2776 length:192 start_codon:yes stop_codon:yes gene_type:complete
MSDLNHDHIPFKVTLEDKEEVLNMRKLELLIDTLQTLESANSSDLYGVKLNIIDKIDRLVSRL